MSRVELRVLILAAGALGLCCTGRLEAPAPTVSAVSPNLVCNARDTSGVIVSGAHFLPLVSGAGSAPRLELPKVFLSSPSGDVQLGDVSVTDASTLLVQLRQGLSVGSFKLSVENPDGGRGGLEAAVTVVPPPAPSTVAPDRGFRGEATSITVKGLGFRPTPALVLRTSPPTPLTGVTLVSATELKGTIPAGLEPGTYDLAVTDAEGCTTLKQAAFQVTRLPAITLASIDPIVGWTGGPTRVAITGINFAPTPQLALLVGGVRTALTRVAFHSPRLLTAEVPAGLPVGGAYELVVENPASGGTASLEGAFAVVKSPPPAIDSVTPAQGVSNSPTSVTIAGSLFEPKATVELIGVDGRALSLTGLNITPGSITGLVPTVAAGPGSYLVRVTNPDKSRADFASFGVRQPPGNLGSFTPSSSLKTARQNLVALASREASGRNGAVLAVGGDDGAQALATVEIAPLDAFGRLGEWKVQRSRLRTPRTGHVAAIRDGFLFVVGGSSDLTTPLASVERAQLLGSDPGKGELPVITSSAVTTGTLPAGTWYYAVAAVMGAGDPDNPLGETVASEEEVVRVSGIVGGVTLTWKTVPGADHYRVYRSDGPDGVSGSLHLLADTVPGPAFTDDGTRATDPQVAPLPPGSLGVFLAMPVTLNRARRAAAGSVAVDPAGQTFLYVTGGADTSSDALSETELAAFGGRGELKPFTTATAPLLRSRMSHGALTADPLSAPALGTPAPYLLVTGGFGFAAGGGTRTSLASTESAEILPGGQLGAFQTVPSYTNDRAGPVTLLSASAWHVFGGLSGTKPRDTGEVTQAVSCGTCPAFRPWTGASSRLRTGRAFAGSATEGPIWFVIGGSDGAAPLATVEQAIH